MIAFLDGKVAASSPLAIWLDVRGVGYEIHAPLSTTTRIGPVGSDLKIHTQLIVREDSHALYGFLSLEEKKAFIALTEKVSGIGPKIALSILSQLSVTSLVHAVREGNVQLLTQCPGIGKKTAERLVLELKDAFKSNGVDTGLAASLAAKEKETQGLPDREADAVAALVTLGFKAAESQKRVSKILASPDSAELTVENIIKQALTG
jgi:Holliday junction DNA helicase RuvA